MFERPQKGERALLVHLKIHQFTEQATLEEFEELVRSTGAQILGKVTGTRPAPDSTFFIGSGKLEEIKTLVTLQQIEVVLFNHPLSPAQERNLERELQCRVLDRTGVILDIFAQRARSFEGKLQVELAQLQHLSTRLVRGWTHLERQKGGIGLRGPGETQLETDRRLLAERIKAIHKRLEKVKQQRTLSRRARQRAEFPTVSLVGYTNAGKSTLFNLLTNAQVYVADQLFATLDSTVRRVDLPDRTALILVDTVGFIQQLPHDLIAAFRATLEETSQAELLLHVVDVSDEQATQHIEQVNQVLTEIDANEIPQIIIYNKIDQLEQNSARVERNQAGQITKIWLSAKQGHGLNLLEIALMEHLHETMVHHWIRIPVKLGQLRAHLFALGAVLHEHYAENGDSLLEIQVKLKYFNQLIANEPSLQLIDEPDSESELT